MLRLDARGHRVRVATTGEKALEVLARHPVDVVVLDILMPGMDGITTLMETKAMHPLVEVILLTGHASVETAVEGMKRGAFDYVTKPHDFEDLLEKLTAARERKADHEERIRQAEARRLTRRTGDA
jgi:DNA-binding NtrC family response regulator